MLARDLIALRCGPLARPIGAVAGRLFLVVTDSQVYDCDLQPFALLMGLKINGLLYRDIMSCTQ